jgi:hypothetical protein
MVESETAIGGIVAAGVAGATGTAVTGAMGDGIASTESGAAFAAGAAVFALPGRNPRKPCPVTADAVTTPERAIAIVVADRANADFRFIW